MEKTRNNTADILRIIAAYCVISLHNMSGSGFFLAENVVAFCRFAVPLFFLISGYFSARFDRSRLKKQVLRLLMLTLTSNLAYFVIGLLRSLRTTGAAQFMREKFTRDALKNFLLLNETPLASHLWFFSALLYAVLLDYLIFIRLMNSRWGRRAVTLLAWGVLLGGYLYYHLGLTVFGKSFNWWDYRNFIFMGTPLYLLGKLFRGSRLSGYRPHFLWLFGLFLLFSATAQAEFKFFGVREVYLSSYLAAGSLLMLANSWPLERAGRVSGFVAGLGRKYSLYVFTVHVFFLDEVREVFYRFVPWRAQKWAGWFIPPAVFLLSLLAAFIYRLCKERISAHISKNKARGSV